MIVVRHDEEHARVVHRGYTRPGENARGRGGLTAPRLQAGKEVEATSDWA